MAQYTIEDIEILRRKSGISYEEAVNLLEYHNGSLARSLVDLEKNGRIKDDSARSDASHTHRRKGYHVINSLYHFRIKLIKGSTTVVNLSVLFWILSLLMASWLVIIGSLVALSLGYRFTLERRSDSLGNDSVEDMVKNAGNNVRNTLFNIARDISAKTRQDSTTDAASEPVSEPEVRTENPASGTTPVNVQFSEDGNVRVSEDADGFHEADIQ